MRGQPGPEGRVPGSYKDPSGNVFLLGGRVLRSVNKPAYKDWHALLDSGLFQKLQEKQFIPQSWRVPVEHLTSFISTLDIVDAVEHERVPVVSYPYEWSFGMLKDGALFVLDLLDECLKASFILKDGTSYNVQFIGTQPVFIDILSVIPYEKGAPWPGYRQFCELFLFPLMLMGHIGIPFNGWLRGELDGIDISVTRRMFRVADWHKAGVLRHVIIQWALQQAFAAHRESVESAITRSPAIAGLVEKNVAHLRKSISKLHLKRHANRSAWTSYRQADTYSEQDAGEKRQFVDAGILSARPARLVDLGCNTGDYSLLAAQTAEYVVAVDADHQCVDYVYRLVKSRGIKNILPLVVDTTNPSPDLGWMLMERQSFPSRAKSDMALVLAFVHHIVLASRIPLEQLVRWLASLAKVVIVEFVTADDPAAGRILASRSGGVPDYTLEAFEYYCKDHFRVARKKSLSSGTRVLYMLETMRGQSGV